MAVVKDADVARRIARAVVSDIALYNAKKVEEGSGTTPCSILLKGEIEEGQVYYLSRVDPRSRRARIISTRRWWMSFSSRPGGSLEDLGR